MRNRDEVIKDFENLYLSFITTCDVDEYHDALFKDVLRLLKEQEPVEPIRQMEQTEWTVCGNCRNHIISKWKICPYCGRPVKWKGE